MTRSADRLALYAREDVRDALRERQLYALAGVFALVGAAIAYSAGRSAAGGPRSVEIELASRLFDPFVFLIPLVALGLVAPTLVEKRTTGELTVLLGLPFTRRTVVLATLIGRSVAVGGAVVAAVLVALLVGIAMGVPVDPGRFVVATLGLLLLTVTFTAIAVSISTVARSWTRATFAAFFAYLVFALGFWDQLPMAALYVRHGFAYPDAIPTWVEFARALNPMAAFTNGMAGVSPSLAGGSPPADPAFFERPAFAFGVLVAWIGGTVGFGYRRFRATDL